MHVHSLSTLTANHQMKIIQTINIRNDAFLIVFLNRLKRFLNFCSGSKSPILIVFVLQFQNLK